MDTRTKKFGTSTETPSSLPDRACCCLLSADLENGDVRLSGGSFLCSRRRTHMWVTGMRYRLIFSKKKHILGLKEVFPGWCGWYFSPTFSNIFNISQLFYPFYPCLGAAACHYACHSYGLLPMAAQDGKVDLEDPHNIAQVIQGALPRPLWTGRLFTAEWRRVFYLAW